VKPEQYLTLFKKIRARRVGVVYDPARTGWYVKLARAAAKQQGIELVLREVNDPRQSIAQLASLKGEVDSLWLLPDTTAVSRETLEAYFLFAQQQSVPVVSFTAAHLKLGAVLALEADRVELGKQGGELAQQLLHGAQPAELGVASPRKVSVRVNDAVARRLRYSAELIATLSKR
jgi:putative tryptophan/tyrosine transport system substrate-binding protein